MELSNPKDFPIVMVEWLDSSAPRESGWYEVELDKLKEDALECFSAGFLVAVNEERVVICSSYHEQLNDDKVINTMGLHSIPWEAVTSFEWLYKPEDWTEDEENYDKS